MDLIYIKDENTLREKIQSEKKLKEINYYLLNFFYLYKNETNIPIHRKKNKKLKLLKLLLKLKPLNLTLLFN